VRSNIIWQVIREKTEIIITIWALHFLQMLVKTLDNTLLSKISHKKRVKKYVSFYSKALPVISMILGIKDFTSTLK